MCVEVGSQVTCERCSLLSAPLCLSVRIFSTRFASSFLHPAIQLAVRKVPLSVYTHNSLLRGHTFSAHHIAFGEEGQSCLLSPSVEPFDQGCAIVETGSQYQYSMTLGCSTNNKRSGFATSILVSKPFSSNTYAISISITISKV